MLIDAHVYCLPPHLRKPSYELPPAEEPIKAAIYNHPESEEALKKASPEAILASMDENGIDKALLIAFPWATDYLCRETSDYLMGVVNASPRFFCLISVQPHNPNNLKVIESYIKYGALGVKINPVWQGFSLDNPEIDELARMAAFLDFPVMLHVDQAYKKSPASPAEVFAFIKRHPRTKFLLAHLGGLLGLYYLHQPLRKYFENVWFDTAVSSTLAMVNFYIQAGLQKRIIFGTDYPFNHSHSQKQVIEDINNNIKDMFAREDLFVNNFNKLFKKQYG